MAPQPALGEGGGPGCPGLLQLVLISPSAGPGEKIQTRQDSCLVLLHAQRVGQLLEGMRYAREKFERLTVVKREGPGGGLRAYVTFSCINTAAPPTLMTQTGSLAHRLK